MSTPPFWRHPCQRPCKLTRCGVPLPLSAGAIGSYSKCLAPATQVTHAHESFPSGHASFSSGGLGFLAWLFFSAHIYRFKTGPAKDRPTLVGRLAGLLSVACIVGAAFVCASRTRDYVRGCASVVVDIRPKRRALPSPRRVVVQYHFYGDVVAGAVIGAGCAFGSISYYGLTFSNVDTSASDGLATQDAQSTLYP